MIHLELDLGETEANFFVSYLITELHAYMTMDHDRATIKENIKENDKTRVIENARKRGIRHK